MRIKATLSMLLLLAGLAAAQRQKLGTINSETPEGQLLQQIGQESDEAKKLGLMEEFTGKYPRHEGIGWVLGQMIPACLKANQFDKALAAGDKLLAIDPDDLEAAHGVLKAAEGKKDPDQVIKWAGRTSAIARKAAAAPKPKDEDDVEDWKRRVDFAKQVDVYTEYSLSAAALQTADLRKKLDVADALEKQNPDSAYLAQLASQRFQAYTQLQQPAKAVELAMRIVQKDPSNEEMLLVVAQDAMGKNQPDRVRQLASQVLEAVGTKPKPASVSDEAWAQRKTQISARANWMLGVACAGQSKWAEADKALRSALPGIKDTPQLYAEALFYLGLANYKLGEAGQPERIRDAVQFNEQCAAIAGPYQARARGNVKAIRAQYRLR